MVTWCFFFGVGKEKSGYVSTVPDGERLSALGGNKTAAVRSALPPLEVRPRFWGQFTPNSC